MSGRITVGLRNVCKRHQWLTNYCDKTTMAKNCLHIRTAVQNPTRLTACSQSMQTSASSSKRRQMAVRLGIASGIGLGLLASTQLQTKANMSAIATQHPTDPTTIESGWLPKTEEIYAKLLTRVEAGELRLLRTTKEPLNRVVYTLSHPQKGAHFEYALFFEESTEKGISLIQFGPQTQGPPGFVHGGATAAMFDTITAVFINKGLNISSLTANLNINYRRYVHGGASMAIIDSITGVFVHRGLGKSCLTANLNFNFRRPIPLNSTVLAETWVEKIERRKYLLRCEIKSTEGEVYIDGKALWIEVKKQ